MTQDTALAERLDRLEAQIAPLAQSAKAVSELRDELAPRVNEAVQALIAELADVEADFQLEDLVFLLKNAMRNVKNLNFTLDQLKNLIDFAVIAEPMFKTTVPQIIYYLDDMEQNGVFDLLSTGLDVLKRIGSTYSANKCIRSATVWCDWWVVYTNLPPPRPLTCWTKPPICLPRWIWPVPSPWACGGCWVPCQGRRSKRAWAWPLN